MRTRLQTRLVTPLRSIWRRATSSRKRRLSVGVAMVAIALLAAACGGVASSSSSTTTTTKAPSTPSSSTPSSSSSSTASETAFRSCLERNGVTPSSGSTPTPGGAAAGNPNFQTALKACASLRPKGTGGTGGGFGGGGATSTADAAYRNCLTLHGVSLPSRGSTSTTTTIAGVTTTTLPNVTDTSNPTVEAALSACASLKPASTSSPSSSSSTTTTSS